MLTPDAALSFLLGNQEPIKPKTDIEKAIDSLVGEDYFDKAGKDIHKLVKKVITNKQGQKQTVYIDPNKDKTNPKDPKKQEETNEHTKTIGSGTIPKGVNITDDNGKKFHIKEDKQLDFTSEDGSKVTFEVNGVKYHVERSKVKDLKIEGEEKQKESKEEEGSKVVGDKVHMSKEDFKKEHKKLVKTLKNGSQEERNKEAEDQGNELKKLEKTDKKPKEKKEREPQWYDKLNSKGDLSRLPIGIPEESVEVNKGGREGNWTMRWKDPKTGMTVTSYSKEFLKKNSKEKWKRIQNVSSVDIKSIKDKTAKLLGSKDNEKSQSAAIISIIANTGLRPGSRNGFDRTHNRGVSTLSKENVKIKRNTISF